MVSSNHHFEKGENLKISFQKPYHQFTRCKTFSSIGNYRKFLNWVSGEFDLNLQEESDNLKVFFPHKRLSISRINFDDKNICADIHIEAKVLNEGFKLMNNVEVIYKSLE
ncbi:hypothetical protein [Seonamhaeicola maritimus]|uniref:hypothetical protein n=1 Tax=Seonamhaeicola maritimus TaxID=2591822 RepID=UPI002494E1CD|nr:hypothetical protein [Seonamhaeicola maritimus]